MNEHVCRKGKGEKDVWCSVVLSVDLHRTPVWRRGARQGKGERRAGGGGGGSGSRDRERGGGG